MLSIPLFKILKLKRQKIFPLNTKALRATPLIAYLGRKSDTVYYTRLTLSPGLVRDSDFDRSRRDFGETMPRCHTTHHQDAAFSPQRLPHCIHLTVAHVVVASLVNAQCTSGGAVLVGRCAK